jgi:YidC/Oxa1 family membrane protein insertase
MAPSAGSGWRLAASAGADLAAQAASTPSRNEIVYMTLATLLASTTSTTVAGSSKSHGTSLLDPVAKPIADFLALIYSVIPNYGIAIVVLSVAWMIIIAPLTLKSTRSMLAMQKLQPQLKKLQAQHKDDKQAFAQAQMELFREHNVSPFGSCLPMLLPLPVFFALFRVITGLSHMTNGVPTPKYIPPSSDMYKSIVAAGGQLVAFGMNLSKGALSSHSSFLAALPYWILLGVMAATSYFQSSQMMSRNPAAANNPQARLMRFAPLVFVLFCIRFPAGVVLYYTISNLCRILQQDLMYRFDPKVKALVAQEVVEVEELTQEIDDRKAGRNGAGKPAAKPEPGARPSFREMWAQASGQQAPAKNTEAAGDSPAPKRQTSSKNQTPAKGQTSSNNQTSKDQTPAKGQNPSRAQTPPKGQPTPTRSATKNQPSKGQQGKAQAANKSQPPNKNQSGGRNQSSKPPSSTKPSGGSGSARSASTNGGSSKGGTTNGAAPKSGGAQDSNGSNGDGKSQTSPTETDGSPR